MAVIKTALEIALEKTESVKSDKSSIDQFDAKQRGKKLANTFLAEGQESLFFDEIKKTPAGQKDSLKQGIFEVLVTKITLPDLKDETSGAKLEKLGKGIEAVINNKNSKEFSAMFKQLTSLFSRYVQEAAQYEKMIQQQYAPKLRQKEEELSRRLGREIRIDPFQDPEFTAFYNQHMSSLKGNYEPVVEQARQETRRFFD
jgi:tRNA nucleotidyltransferase (CCA-adding enzyme)